MPPSFPFARRDVPSAQRSVQKRTCDRACRRFGGRFYGPNPSGDASMPTAAKLTVAKQRANLAALRESTDARPEILCRGYDELITTGEDVGAGDDEGGSEADGSVVERDGRRAQMGEGMNVLETTADSSA